MEFLANNIIITIFLPVWISIFIITAIMFKLPENKKITAVLTVLSTFICLIFSIGTLNYIKNADNIFIEKNINWLNTGDLSLYLGTLADSTSAAFLALLMFVSILVQIYSYGYMKDKENFNRYYIYLNFFNFSMAGLILASNLIQIYIFWELVGVASYLLIGFFYKEDDVSNSAKKVFFINRTGDCALLLGIITMLYFSTVYQNSMGSELLFFTNIDDLKLHLEGLTTEYTYNLILLLFAIGAFVKSAQFPFHTWLIDAMKAPTPVSALIHSATMVCMGIFLMIRIYPLLSDELLNILLIAGAITALICAFCAVGQKNIKKMLAYSTSSQLGFIFIALGLKSLPAAIIYLVIHSFTKALLFLCAGSISNTYNSLNMSNMGGLRHIDFYMSGCWLIGALSLSGLFFGGFTSKEILINLLSDSNNNLLLFIILLSVYMTCFYIFRAYFSIFEGEKQNIISKRDISMTSSIMILSIFVIFPGFIFKLTDLNILCLIVFLINILALISAYFSFKTNKLPFSAVLINLSENGLYLPTLYNKSGNLFLKLSSGFNIFDKAVIDKFINSTATFSNKISAIISKLQNGNIQTYLSYSVFITGCVLTALIYLYFTEIRG